MRELLAFEVSGRQGAVERLDRVATSKRTLESTSVAVDSPAWWMTRRSLATEKLHDLVGAHRGRGRAPQTLGGTLTAGPTPPAPADLQRVADLHDLDLVAGLQAIPLPQLRGDGELILAVEPHETTSRPHPRRRRHHPQGLGPSPSPSQM